MSAPKRVVHVAVDIETLGKTPSSVVLSVGLAAFTVQGGIVSTWYAVLNREHQEAAGRKVDPDTLEWWAKQPIEAKAVLYEADEVSVPLGHHLSAIRRFINRFEEPPYELGGVWGFGSDFDNATLQDLNGTREPLWDYRKNRCGRTLVAITKTPRPPSVGVQHHALDDARFQANWFRAALQTLGEK